MSKITQLVLDLKEKNEDFEFYPTSKEMIKPIYEYIKSYRKSGYGGCKIETEDYSLLDIGAGTCNFQKYYSEFIRENTENVYNKDYELTEVQVIEKSDHLIKMLPVDTIVMGVDFHMTSLFDKKIDTIFSNPPYSEYEEWTRRIVYESTAEFVFMIIPQRWKNSKIILETIEKTNTKFKILGEFNFLEADRRARAVVDVVVFEKSYSSNSAFDDWFEQEFKPKPIEDKKSKNKKEKQFKDELSIQENKVDFLVNCYNLETKKLQKNLKAACTMDHDVLKDIGTSISEIKASLKSKLLSLKNKYWACVFQEIDSVRDKLTEKYRREMLQKFTKANTIDFTHQNIYSTIIWIIKNANKYHNVQVTDLYEKLSSYQNVKPYKSNKKFFDDEKTRYSSWHQHKPTKYTLDYRIVCSGNFTDNCRWMGLRMHHDNISDFINDICVVASNLRFFIGQKEAAIETGKKYYIYQSDGKVLFEYKVYKNSNFHIKMSLEFSKAFNVEASRLLGWIKDKSDLKKELNHKHLKDCEKYFKANLSLPLNGQLLLG